ncbi:sce7725 family protein, partial [Staphylococcus aureus]|nr:sce7725 family protein [Staphylococcus aureus]
ALHSYYKDENNIGFGDYTITGNDFIEGGGPAYVVTVHASYIDSQRFDELFIRHYSSEDDGTPTNPGAKFKQALTKLISDFQSKRILFEETEGLQEFIFLYKIGHFPGLGQVKKISIMHHIETINIYLESKD